MDPTQTNNKLKSNPTDNCSSGEHLAHKWTLPTAEMLTRPDKSEADVQAEAITWGRYKID